MNAPNACSYSENVNQGTEGVRMLLAWAESMRDLDVKPCISVTLGDPIRVDVYLHDILEPEGPREGTVPHGCGTASTVLEAGYLAIADLEASLCRYAGGQ